MKFITANEIGIQLDALTAEKEQFVEDIEKWFSLTDDEPSTFDSFLAFVQELIDCGQTCQERILTESLEKDRAAFHAFCQWLHTTNQTITISIEKYQKRIQKMQQKAEAMEQETTEHHVDQFLFSYNMVHFLRMINHIYTIFHCYHHMLLRVHLYLQKIEEKNSLKV